MLVSLDETDIGVDVSNGPAEIEGRISVNVLVRLPRLDRTTRLSKECGPLEVN